MYEQKNRSTCEWVDSKRSNVDGDQAAPLRILHAAGQGPNLPGKLVLVDTQDGSLKVGARGVFHDGADQNWKQLACVTKSTEILPTTWDRW